MANYLLTSHTRSQQQVASDDHERLLAALKAGNFTRAHDIIEDHIQGAWPENSGENERISKTISLPHHGGRRAASRTQPLLGQPDDLTRGISFFLTA